MHKLILSFFVIIIIFFASSDVFASGGGVVIKSIQLGNSSGASNEFIEVYNNGDKPVDITNWCLYYASAANDSNGAKIGCVTTDNPNIYVFIQSHATMLAVSSQFYQSSGISGDLKFDATLSAAAGHIRIIDDEGIEIDKIAWGDAALSPEGSTAASIPSNSQIITRKMISEDVLKDTDFNFDDFEVVDFIYSFRYGQIYEVQDICSNIPEIQSVVPDGYSVDLSSRCVQNQIDFCQNIDEFQSELPIDYGINNNGDCVPDTCLNIESFQYSVPAGYKLDGNNCLLDLLNIELSEFLPNPIGTDIGGEFIEIFNPNDQDINLDNYTLIVGSDRKKIIFPLGSMIGPRQFKSFSDIDLSFNLVNSLGGISIESVDGQIIDDFISYQSAGDGVSWAKINSTWRYTNQPTPGSINLESLVDELVVNNDTDLKPCAPNQYRSLETNRCRLIEVDNTVPIPCGDGQYRSEETNRCRNIVSDVISLVPCAEGQERNPATNRCRSISGDILGVNNLKPCKEDQERNPETNRCRNIKGEIAEVAYKPEQVQHTSGNKLLFLSVAGVILLAVGYGFWEWRADILKIINKLKEKISR